MKTKIILASSSPRRIELMRQVGFKPFVLSPEADEAPLPGESPRKMVVRLARLKAEAAISTLHETNAIIISADTIVIAPDGKTVFGKPSSKAQAFKMLNALADHTHTVLTAYCVVRLRGRSQKELVRVVSSKVLFRPLSPTDIRHYIASGEPMDKAGSYAAQGLGTALIKAIRGSYTNVVGLPMAELLYDLEHEFRIPLFKV